MGKFCHGEAEGKWLGYIILDIPRKDCDSDPTFVGERDGVGRWNNQSVAVKIDASYFAVICFCFC